MTVVQNLNDSLDDYAVREQAGKDLLDLLSADYFASYVWDDDGRNFARPVFLNMSPENLALYEQYFQYNDPITFKLQPYRRAVSVNEVIDQKDLLNTEFFTDFLDKDGLFHGINIYVYDNGNKNIGDFRIWRGKKKSNFSRSDLKILDMIAPHFRNAMRNIEFAKHLPPTLDLDDICKKLADEYSLTKREREIAVAVLHGKSDRQISSEKNISVATLRTHLRHIFHKVDVGSRAELCGRVVFDHGHESRSQRLT